MLTISRFRPPLAIMRGPDSLWWTTAFQSIAFTGALIPILLGSAFGNWDALIWVYPHTTLIADRLFSMNMFWNDLNAWGFASSFSVGYPFQPLLPLLLPLLRDPIVATNVTITFYIVLAACAATLFLRREGWPKWTSLFGGTTYAFMLWSWMYEIGIIVVPPLLIITLLAFQQSEKRPTIATITAASAISLLWLGSHAHYAVMAFGVAWIYLISRIAHGGPMRRYIVVGVTASLTSIAVGLLRYLPLMAHAMLSSRPQESVGMGSPLDLKLPVLLFFIARLPVALPWTSHSYQFIPHMGALSGACMLLAMTQARRLRALWPHGAIALLSLILLLPGVSTIPFTWPPVRLLGSPDRWLFVGMIAMIPIACAGFTLLVRNAAGAAASRIGWLYSAVGLTLLSAVVIKSMGRGEPVWQSHLLFPSLSATLAGMVFLLCRFRAASAATIGIASVMLTLFGTAMEWRIPLRNARGNPQFLPSSSQEIVHTFAAKSITPPARSSKTYFHTLFHAETNLFHDVAVTASQDPLLPQRTLNILHLLGSDSLRTTSTATVEDLVQQLRAHDDLLPALGVRWVLSPHSLEVISALELREQTPAAEGVRVYRYEVRDTKPRAYALPAVSLYEPRVTDMTMRLIQGRKQARAVVECPRCSGQYASSGIGSFEVREWNPTNIRIDVVTPEDQWVAIRRAAVPGMKVAIDGQPTPFAFAHGILLALFVPQGNHTVTVSYEYRQLLKDSVQILLRGSCLWCSTS